ncbi:dihydrolipoyl dehydrogenase [Martelella alba]|uniref:Dihydrolipoyl dehydrogenase n=1 Tax=Martelella alba TaxID=2590451 RepID=A0ABY2SEF8_9HYPH|nr:dihydrolipoyl dehydrogenase [Martelella alba]TKI02268.1 dihydrolipoyl dehydrogenase [Martelella alba]
MKTDILVIGGGPGGHVAAIKATEFGGKAIVVEKYKLGGTCLHMGCIPTKTLLHTTDVLDEIKHAKTLGINVGTATVDMNLLQQRKNEIINTITSGVNQLVASKNVDVIYATARLVDEHNAILEFENGTRQEVAFARLIIATGSVPTQINIPGVSLPEVITSNEALSLNDIPDEMVIIGGGVIGIEFAQLMNRLGTKVSIIEAYQKILSHMDDELSEQLAEILRKEGINIYVNAKVSAIEKSEKGVSVSFEKATGTSSLTATKVLMSVGRKPLVHGFGLENTSVELKRGAIVVNEFMQTNVPHIYAIGDCTGGYMLAHVAVEQGIVAAKHMTKNSTEGFDQTTVPACVYTSPEFASVGLSENAAREQIGNIKLGKTSLEGNAKTMIVQQTGMVKFIVDGLSHKVLGLQILGPRASDLIHEAALAIKLGATIEDIIHTIHGHPTIAEGVHEAAEDVFSNAIYKMYANNTLQ